VKSSDSADVSDKLSALTVDGIASGKNGIVNVHIPGYTAEVQGVTPAGNFTAVDATTNLVDLGDDKYLVQNMTGNVQVEVKYTLDSHDLTITNTASVSTLKVGGTDYTEKVSKTAGSYTITFTVTDADKYTYQYKVNDGDAQNVAVSEGTGTINVTIADDDVTVEITKVAKTYSVTLPSGTGIVVSEGASSATYDTNYTFTVSAAAGYTLSDTNYKIGSAADVAYTAGDQATITGSSITDNIVIRATATANDNEITFTAAGGANATNENGQVLSSVTAKTGTTVTFKVVNGGRANVTTGTATLTTTDGVTYTLSGFTDAVTVTISNS
jgi:hypothetical protein